jgi:energy-converting hydrogenase B subunit D
MPEPALDLALGAMLLWVAWRTVANADLYKATILFIVFGLLLSLVWVRLSSPDIALAEAAIGAGLTGALLLDAVGQVRRRQGESQRGSAGPEPGEGQGGEYGPP